MHLAGAVGGGALLGAGLGLAGSVLELGRLRAWIVGGAAVIALLISVTRSHFELGRPCQVPRKWSRSMPAYRRFFVWGTMLGAGVVTLIPYPAYLLLLSAQATSGTSSAAIAGALFGLAREGPALLGVFRSTEPEETMEILPRLRPAWRAVNVSLIVTGGAALILTAL